LVTCLKTGTSSVCQFYDSPRQLICFLRTFFRVREADLLKSTVHVGPIVVQNCAHGLPRLPGSYSIHKQFFRQTHCFTYIVGWICENVLGSADFFDKKVVLKKLAAAMLRAASELVYPKSLLFLWSFFPGYYTDNIFLFHVTWQGEGPPRGAYRDIFALRRQVSLFF
jgi:hypothetical protein